MELNKIYNMDCVEGMRMLPDNSVDLTVTSPPYDNLRTYNGFEWDFEATARELYRVTKEGGVVVWVVGDSTIKGSESGTSFKQALFFKECGFNLHDTMLYAKNNPMPNAQEKRYMQSFEYMFVFSKGKVSSFHPIMVQCTYAGTSTFGNPSTWDASGKLTKKGKRKINDFKKKSNIFYYTVGSTNGKSTKHPAVFPEQLAQDQIVSWSNEGDVVLDCFMGSGTTAIAAIKSKRNFIGFELSKEYCEVANKRVFETTRQIRLEV